MCKIGLFLVAFGLFTAACGSTTDAAEGDPVAIRLWPGDVVTVESMGGLTIGIGLEKHDSVGGHVDQWVQCDAAYDHVLSRIPNEPAPSFDQAEQSNRGADNMIQITSLSDNNAKLIIAQVDGVRIAVGSFASVADLRDQNLKTDSLDTLVVIGDTVNSSAAFAEVVERLSPRYLLFRGDDEVPGKIIRLVDSNGTIQKSEKRSHNTFCVAASSEVVHPMKMIAMETAPWQPQEDLAKLFKAMSDSNQKSQTVFAKLSADQMNFRPSNGSHTPRWNAEHMMGRQLMFFSQIYHAIDPTIPVMDLNPAQMPEDYSAAHADWNGAEEARHMQRVDDFCHRFAYLLDGMELSQKAKGSRWPTLKALLVQMDRHYREHTANTIKKFELEDWPEQ